MARQHPGQLSLFDPAAPPLPAPPDIETAAEYVAEDVLEPAAPGHLDRLVLAVPVSGKSGGALLSSVRQARPDGDLPVAPIILVLDFGPFAEIDVDETEAILEACDRVEMRRFEACFSSAASLDDGTLALMADEGGLGAFADILSSALREQDAPAPEARQAPHLPLGPGGDAVATVLDRPLKLPVREFALLRVGQESEIIKKWSLPA